MSRIIPRDIRFMIYNHLKDENLFNAMKFEYSQRGDIERTDNYLIHRIKKNFRIDEGPLD